jgi:hypothetical protein
MEPDRSSPIVASGSGGSSRTAEASRTGSGDEAPPTAAIVPMRASKPTRHAAAAIA